jgi:hypothetical protein
MLVMLKVFLAFAFKLSKEQCVEHLAPHKVLQSMSLAHNRWLEKIQCLGAQLGSEHVNGS